MWSPRLLSYPSAMNVSSRALTMPADGNSLNNALRCSAMSTSWTATSS